MKLNEIFNNYPNVYFNVLPSDHASKPSGTMIAAIMRARADDQGTMDTEYEHEAQSSKLWPKDASHEDDDDYYEEPEADPEEWDAGGEEDDWEEELTQYARKALEKESNETQLDKVNDRNRKSVSKDVVYR